MGRSSELGKATTQSAASSITPKPLGFDVVTYCHVAGQAVLREIEVCGVSGIGGPSRDAPERSGGPPITPNAQARPSPLSLRPSAPNVTHATVTATMRFLEDARLEGPAWLEPTLLPFFSSIGLPKLAGLAHISLASCVASFTLQWLSSVISPVLFPKTYPKLKAKANDWDLHVVSQAARPHPARWAPPLKPS